MTTKEAIQSMLDGKKVTPKEWSGFYVFFNGIHFEKNDKTQYMFGSLEYDWEIYEEPKKQKVVIEKWLIKSNFDFSFQQVVQTDSIDNLCYCCDYTKVKLLDTYEVEL